MRRLICVMAALGLFSCAGQIEHKMKSPLLIGPEAQGSNRATLGAGYASSPLVVITDDARTSPPDRSRPRISHEEKILLLGGFGVLDRLDFYLDPASWFTGRFQVLGDPYPTAAEGNFSASVLASVWDERGSANENPSISPTLDFSKDVTSWRAGALTGYRFSDSFLLYTGYTYQSHRYRGDYFLPTGSRGRYAGTASAHNISLGFEFSISKAFVIRLEDCYSMARAPMARRNIHTPGILFAGTIELFKKN